MFLTEINHCLPFHKIRTNIELNSIQNNFTNHSLNACNCSVRFTASFVLFIVATRQVKSAYSFFVELSKISDSAFFHYILYLNLIKLNAWILKHLFHSKINLLSFQKKVLVWEFFCVIFFSYKFIDSLYEQHSAQCVAISYIVSYWHFSCRPVFNRYMCGVFSVNFFDHCYCCWGVIFSFKSSI